MSLQLRQRPPQLQPQLVAGGPPADEPEVAVTAGHVRVNYAVHTGSYPIGGMRLRDARQVLARIMNIDESAVAVVNGAVVDEDEVIGDDVRVLHFVKPSSVKGASRV